MALGGQASRGDSTDITQSEYAHTHGPPPSTCCISGPTIYRRRPCFHVRSRIGAPASLTVALQLNIPPDGAPMCECGIFSCIRLLTERLTLPRGGAVMSHGTFTCRTPRTAVCTAIANRTNAQCLWWQRLRRTTGQSSGCAQRPDGL